MTKAKILIISVIVLLFFGECTSKKKIPKNTSAVSQKKIEKVPKIKEKKEPRINRSIVLNDNNAIPFFYNYQKENLEDKVRITTRFGNIDVRLFKNTPYHRANFIYLTKKGYFNGTTFHRVVPGFIIQGGNSDRYETSKKRSEIGKYLLPPDTRKGHKHHRGVISVPSSEIENPYKLASPFEFFIVQQDPGAYHLDGSYTVFGEVITGIDVVDQINNQRIDSRETPLTNVFMEVSVIE
jgi:cyclophilin family peptidyl-prolyl cis-trans isomerase|tara:strand:+ start:708 stop:1421 length:714 start_codon:yes stop_codon:yes gene_type:complete